MPLPLVALAAAAAVELSTTAPPVPPSPEPPNAPNAPSAPNAPTPAAPTAPLPPASAAPARARLQAALAATAPTIDGAVDEAAWRAAPVFRAFVQSYPRYGQPPSERTEARVLYDARNLYVSVIAYQAPASILAPLSSRDRLPASDLVSIGIDADRDGKTARVFAVNAAGVQLDSLLYDDSKLATGWDAVWEARTRRRADGWSAELRIPLHLLRIPEATASGEAPALGFIVRRLVGATREEIDSAALPHDQGSIVSRYGELAGLGARATSGVELSPYLASIAGREQGQAAARFDVGLDLRWQSARGPSLAAALNPDFSQVEADEQVANFGNQELERAEKRLFFTDGLDLFAPTDAGDLIAGHNLFYSRRIGLDTPILGAAKLTGAAGPLELGAFTALVSPSRVLTAERGEPSVLEDDEPGATTAFAAAALRARLSPRAALRGNAVAVQPFQTAMRCADDDGDACRGEGALTAAAGWDVRSASGEWGLVGQLAGSLITRGVRGGRVLRDGTHLEEGDAGLGGYVRLSKLDGAPWRFTMRHRFASRYLDLNAGGLLAQQNEHFNVIDLGYVRPEGVGPLLGLDVGLRTRAFATAAPLHFGGGIVAAHAQAILPGFHRARCEAGGALGRVDARELDRAGVRLERPSFTYGLCELVTDEAAPLSVRLVGYSGQVYARSASSPRMIDGGGGLTVVWRPMPRWETSLAAYVDSDVEGPRWIESDGEVATLGTLTPRVLSATLRQTFVVSPRLSLTSYAQLFTESRRFGQLFEGSLGDGDYLDLHDLMPVDGPDPSTHEASLLLRAALRWEYRLGSLLQLAYTRSQEEPEAAPGMKVARGLGVGRLTSGPVHQELAFKLSYYWGS